MLHIYILKWEGPSMTVYQLECFIAVAEELNFSAAAARMFTTQPSITYQISALERETGLHLFDLSLIHI